MAEGGKRPAADFGLAFTPGRRFRRDGWRYRMAVVPVADLRLPTGRIVAADPGTLRHRPDEAFTRTVPPGLYPVDLAVRHTTKVGERGTWAATACLRVRFRETAVAEWVIATCKGQDPDDLPPFQIYGYGVDVGMGSFADAAGLAAARRRCEAEGKTLYDGFFSERVLPAFEATGGRSADVPLDPATGANLVACTSGHGDGFYASYWGLGRNGQPVCLVTDFGLLTHHVHEARDLGPLADLIDRERRLRLPGGTLRLRLERPNARKVIVRQSGTASGTCEVGLRRNGKPVPVSGGTISYGGRQRTAELRFVQSVPADVTVAVTYLDRIEPL
jgi:hypothetical protein